MRLEGLRLTIDNDTLVYECLLDASPYHSMPLLHAYTWLPVDHHVYRISVPHVRLNMYKNMRNVAPLKIGISTPIPHDVTSNRLQCL